MRNFLLLTCAAAALSVSANTPYIYKVYDYCPAPGQFINELPEYEQGDDYATILAKAGEQLVGDRMPGMISLGAWGGYVVFGFDHPVVNKPGAADFKIYGNAIISDIESGGGSSEPGIVMVSKDVNGNGLPDDPWYELAGSEYTKPGTIKGYEITYEAPKADHVAVPDPVDKSVIDSQYISWTSNDTSAANGYVTKVSHHTQSYWPQWLSDTDKLTFKGTKIADNYEDVSGNGSYFVLKFYDFGYADNLPNGEDKGFNIEWAVDADGVPVKLDSVDFIRVHTGVNQTCGRLGESSTEISGAEDLHPDYSSSVQSVMDEPLLLITSNTSERITVRTDKEMCYTIFTATGALSAQGTLFTGENTISINELPTGLNVLHTPASTIKFIKH